MTKEDYEIIDEQPTIKKKVKKSKINKNSEKILKPHGVAVWLLNHYPKLTVVQISNFCGLDQLKIGFLKTELNGGKLYATSNPVLMGYVTKENLEYSSENPQVPIIFVGDNTLKVITNKRTKRKYVSLKERKDKVSAALWIINYYKNIDLTPEDVKSLTGASIVSIRKILTDRKYALSIIPLDPTKSSICTRQDIEKIISKYVNTNVKS